MIVPRGNVRGLWVYITLVVFVVVLGFLLYESKHETPTPTTKPLQETVNQ
jgi:hypothetical protein